MKRTLACTLIVGSALAMTACVGGSSKVTTAGTYVSDDTLARFEENVTTEQQVIDLLGHPDRSVGWKDDGTLHVWKHESTEKASGHVFLLVSGNSESVRQRSVYVACRDGYVQEWWSEEFAH